MFLPSVCIHNKTREWKTNKKVGWPGSIHHVSGCEVNVGGGWAVKLKYVCVLNLKVSFLVVKTSSFDHTNVWSPKRR